MKKKKTNIVIYGYLCMVILCILVFVWLAHMMSQTTQQMIDDISNVHMKVVNEQLQQKFDTLIELRMGELEEIVNNNPPRQTEYGETLVEGLQKSARRSGLSSLAFCRSDGTLETIYGEAVTLTDDRSRSTSYRGQRSLVEGTSEKGENVILIVVEAAYPMADGGESVALVAGLPSDYLNVTMHLNDAGTSVYTHVIEPDGDFIIKNDIVKEDNYFERMVNGYRAMDGGSMERYVDELQAAIEAKEDYSFIVQSGEDSHMHIYCSSVAENADWYLVTVMPDGEVSGIISQQGRENTYVAVGSAAVILIVMSVIFFCYYYLTHQQLREIDAARRDAVRANRAKSDFLSSMSHDIRTPMNAIVGMSEIALKNVEDPVRVEDCLRKVKLSSKHLLGLINDVLDMSKIESGKMTLSMNPVSLRDVMDDIVNIVQPQVKARNQLFDIYIKDIFAENVQCDSVRLNQVLLNLLSNAIKFTPEEGRVDVHMYQEASSRGEEYVCTHFIVEDNGIGMSKEFQEHIWELFAREESETVQHITGSGLGMAITKRIVDLMNGKITVKSKPGEGSRFHVVLELRRAEVSEEEMQLPDWKVLVVDDNEMLCTSAAANLTELGVQAEWTCDGRDAVRRIEEHHNAGDDYHVVLVDWKMPNMDGIQTIHEIRERVGRGIPLFLISAYDWNDIESEIGMADIEGFISKPLFKSTLYTHLSKYAGDCKAQAVEEDEEQVHFNGKRILMAEDIDINWEIAYEILSEYGLLLDRAVNGKECVEQFQASEEGYYDAILMDIRMPVMNGYDAAMAIRRLERSDKDLPIIAMTADAFSDDAQRCLECGMNAHIPKPLDVKECTRILKQYLE